MLAFVRIVQHRSTPHRKTIHQVLLDSTIHQSMLSSQVRFDCEFPNHRMEEVSYDWTIWVFRYKKQRQEQTRRVTNHQYTCSTRGYQHSVQHRYSCTGYQRLIQWTSDYPQASRQCVETWSSCARTQSKKRGTQAVCTRKRQASSELESKVKGWLASHPSSYIIPPGRTPSDWFDEFSRMHAGAVRCLGYRSRLLA